MLSTRGLDIPNIDVLGTKDEEDDEEKVSGDDKDGAEAAVEEPSTKRARWFN